MKNKVFLILCALLVGAFMSVSGQDEGTGPPGSPSPPAPASDVTAHVEIEGNQRVALVHWRLPDENGVSEYVIMRALTPEGPFEERGRVTAGVDRFRDILEMPTDSAIVADTMNTVDVVAPAPPTGVVVADRGNDHGHAINVSWDLSADDGTGMDNVIIYGIYRARGEPDIFLLQGEAFKGDSTYADIGSKEEHLKNYMPDHVDYYYKVRAKTNQYQPGQRDYFYKVRAVAADTTLFSDSETSIMDGTVFSDSEIAGPVQSYGQWFNTDRLSVLFLVAGFLIVTIFFIQKAKGGADLFVRRLAGIEAVDEAIGRATEMGKPILYVLGLGTAADIATIASYTILGRVAKKIAEYQTGLIVPCYDPIVMTVAQETVKTAYMDAGRPDAYHQDIVYFVTNQQFAYVAAVNGVMMRERPATNLYMGKFYAESLILAETGVVAGSIQISGTDEISQIPFFVVACDYTLIGEELYAASAYLGREPLLLGSLKAQDYAKAGVIILTVAGFLAMIFGWEGFRDFFHVTN